MANEKRLIDANAINERCRATKLIEVFPEWKQLPISAQKAVCRLGNYFKNIVQEAPTVDAVEVVHGKWIEEREIPSYSNKNIPVVECSKCRCLFCDIINVHTFMYHYFPNCGAKMDGGNEDG